VQPSQTEGLPRALIEAMSRGCPCIGSNAGGIPELLDNAHIFSSGNVKELATILASFDIEKMITQAKRNYEFSKGYAKEIIETRRNDFLKEFAEGATKHD
jgi:glycosyltransferase involved in cell wall biosynthesis